MKQKRSYLRHLCALALCLCLMLGLWPIAAMAEELPIELPDESTSLPVNEPPPEPPAEEPEGGAALPQEEPGEESPTPLEDEPSSVSSSETPGPFNAPEMTPAEDDGGVLATQGAGDGFSSDGVWYVEQEGGLTVSIEQYTSITDPLSITSLTIPDTVTDLSGVKYDVVSIGDEAFKGYNNLVTITINATQLVSIGESAFENTATAGNTALTSLSIPASVTSIGKSAFKGYNALASLTFESGIALPTIDEAAFSATGTTGNTALTSLSIPASVTSIGKDAFSGCNALASLTFGTGSGLQTIGEAAFENTATAGNTALASLSIPAGVTSIGKNAFLGYNALSALTFAGSQLQTIGEAAFSASGPTANTALTSLVIPASVTSIEKYAFRGFNALQTLTFAPGSQLHTIGEEAFIAVNTGNTSLTALSIPATVTAIGDSAFLGYRGLQSLTFAPNSQLQSIGNSAFSVSAKGNTALAALSIPATVKTIGESAFRGYSGLQSLTFAAGSQLQTIGNNAFNMYGGGYNGNASLTSIVIPASVTSIGHSAFRGCKMLSSISFSPGSQPLTIGIEAFQVGSDENGALTTLVIPARVVSINDYAFNGFNALTSVTFQSPTAPAMQYDVFNSPGLTVFIGQDPSYDDSEFRKAFPDDCIFLRLVTQVNISPASAALKVGATQQLNATIGPDNADNKTVTWASSHPDIASVSQGGIVTAKAPGKATITATAQDGAGAMGSCTITVSPVTIPVGSISLSATSATLMVKQTQQLSATVAPANATNRAITWESSNTGVASVDQEGKVTAEKAGNAVITATAQDGSGVAGSCAITVENPVTKVQFSQASIVLQQGKSATIKAAGYTLDGGSNGEVTYKSNKPTVVKVHTTSGKLTASKTKTGTAKITAIAPGGKKAVLTVKVVKKGTQNQKVKSVSANVPKTMKLGQIRYIKPGCKPAGAQNVVFSYKSNKPAILSVDRFGRLIAMQKGTAIITVKGGGMSKTFKVKVN